jgi:Uma2 family endonuclease
MTTTLSLTDTIIERLEMGESELRIGASVEEYFEMLDAFEEQPYIITYEDDEIIAKMGEATERHELLCGNIIGIFYMNYLHKSGYRVYGSNCAVYSIDDNRGYDPDALVVKGTPQLYDRPKRVKPILNPFIVVEVLSDSNKGKDFKNKINFYKRISTVQHIILIDQHEAMIETFDRSNDPATWLNRVFTNESDVLTIDTFDVSLRSVYQNVLFFNS